MTAHLTGIGWITAAGLGRTGTRTDFAMPAGSLPEIEPAAVFSRPDPYFRRLDAYSRLGVAAVALALKDAGLDRWTAKRNIGIIAATRYGCLQTDLDYFQTVIARDGIAASPSLFSYTLPSIFLGEAALRFGLTGPTFVINRNGLEPRCLQLALESIEDGEADRMLCGVCDLSAPPIAGIDCKQPPGAIFFLLEREPAGHSPACGSVRCSRNNRIFFGRTEVRDLAALVRQCCKSF